ADGNELSGWPVQPNIAADCRGNNVHFVSEASPIVADLKGDGNFEIMLPTNTEVVVWDSSGNQLSRDSFTACNPKPSIYQLLGVGHFNSSAIAVDLDGSGQITVIAAGDYKDGANQLWGSLNAWKFPGTASPKALPWAEFRHDSRNTGFYQPD